MEEAAVLSSQGCTVTGQEGTETRCLGANSGQNRNKNSLEQFNMGIRCSQSGGNLIPCCKYSRLGLVGLWIT